MSEQKTYAPKMTTLVLARSMMRDEFFKKHFGLFAGPLGVKTSKPNVPGYEVIKDGKPDWIGKVEFEENYFEYNPNIGD